MQMVNAINAGSKLARLNNVRISEEENGISCYLMFKCEKPMQLITIWERMKLLYPQNYAAAFEARIKEYEKEIREETLLAHPWKKWICRKTYMRTIRRWLGGV